MDTQCVPVAIIGAGPYGLSLAAHLGAAGIEHRIFGSAMETWRNHMPAGMHLKSEGFASSLYDAEDSFSLGHYCRETGTPYRPVGEPVSLELFARYGQEFQRRFVPHLEPQNINQVRAEKDAFVLTTSTGENVRARRVVLAIGITHFAFIPPELLGECPERVSHSSAYGKLDQFKGRTIAVIGSGSSSVDIAALLHEVGAHVHLLTRRPGLEFHEPPVIERSLLERVKAPRSGLGLGWRSRLCCDIPQTFGFLPERLRLRVIEHHLGPAPAWFMKERVVGKFPVHGNARLVRLQPSGQGAILHYVQQGTARTLELDHVIAGCGYRVSMDRLAFLDEAIRTRLRTAVGFPEVTSHFEARTVPGLYFVGLASALSFGPLTRFAFGARFTARRLARHLVALRYQRANRGGRQIPAPVMAKQQGTG